MHLSYTQLYPKRIQKEMLINSLEIFHYVCERERDSSRKSEANVKKTVKLLSFDIEEEFFFHSKYNVLHNFLG